MCGVYYIDDDTMRDIESIVLKVDRRIHGKQFVKDIHPTDHAPVIVRDETGLKLALQRWGYPGIHKKGVIFNARAEEVMEKPMFTNGIRYHRAIIPARHFYEWSVNREKNTFFRLDRRPLYLAGFFDMMENEDRFVILTTQANDSMRRVHDRMPLVLEQDQLEDWMHDDNAARKLLSQIPVSLQRQVEFEQMTLF